MLQRLGAGASQQAGNSSRASRRGSFAAPRPRALPHHCALLTDRWHLLPLLSFVACRQVCGAECAAGSKVSR
jgi:hypothetical protein